MVNLYQLDPQLHNDDVAHRNQEDDCTEDERDWYGGNKEVHRTVVSGGTWQASPEFKEDNKYVQSTLLPRYLKLVASRELVAAVNAAFHQFESWRYDMSDALVYSDRRRAMRQSDIVQETVLKYINEGLNI